MWKTFGAVAAVVTLGLLPASAFADGRWGRGHHAKVHAGRMEPHHHGRPVVQVAPVVRVSPVWVPGYWTMRHRQRLWIEGAWMTPPSPGWVWVEPRWAWNGRQWIWMEGHFSPAR